MDTVEYSGYTGTVEHSEDDNCFFGKVIDIHKSSITYEGKTILELVSDFNAAIDDYIVECEKNGVDPEKPDQLKAGDNVFLKKKYRYDEMPDNLHKKIEKVYYVKNKKYYWLCESDGSNLKDISNTTYFLEYSIEKAK